MEVIAKAKGYYKDVIREPGTKFVIDGKKDLGEWMEPVKGSKIATNDEPEPDLSGNTEMPLERLNKAELIEHAKAAGIAVADNATKAQIIEDIKAHETSGDVL